MFQFRWKIFTSAALNYRFILCLLIILFPIITSAEEISATTESNLTSDQCGKTPNQISFINTHKNLKQKAKIRLSTCPHMPSAGFAVDCAEIFQAGFVESGAAKIWPKSRAIKDSPFNVYCDMETDGGGWTVIQRRGNHSRPNDYFFRGWDEYRKGFGNIEKDFWLGNDKIFALTNQMMYSVRFDLKDMEGEKRYALYDVFWIDGEENDYTLHIKDYTGDAGDSMIESHNGQKFSTKDKDNDNSEDDACAETHKGAWWYNSCLDSNLNGLYLYGKHEDSSGGVNWRGWKGFSESLAETEIKIRPKNFVNAPITDTKPV